MTTLIAFASIEGQTAKIARFVEDLAHKAGRKTIMFDTTDRTLNVSLDGVDEVILAASVHERRHPRDFEVFISANSERLAALPVLLLSVSLSAAFPEGLEDAQDYLDEMKMRTDLDPDAELLVAGAIKTQKYGFYASQVLRHVVLRGRSYDASVPEHEFTDWKAIEGAVNAFLGQKVSA